MLALSRKEGQTVVIPGIDLVLVVLGIHRGCVRLGFDADPSVRILRGNLIASEFPVLAERVRRLLGRLFGRPILA